MSRPPLKDYRAEKIDVECRRCDRYAVLDRKVLVKKTAPAVSSST